MLCQTNALGEFLKSLRALVVCSDGGPALELAKAVAAGVASTGVETVFSSTADAPESDCRLVFIGGGAFAFSDFGKQVLELVRKTSWEGRKAAVFAACAGGGRKKVDALAQALAGNGANVIGTLAIELPGVLGALGKGVLSENDLVRARAFGEKLAYHALGERPAARRKEKENIRGYLK